MAKTLKAILDLIGTNNARALSKTHLRTVVSELYDYTQEIWDNLNGRLITVEANYTRWKGTWRSGVEYKQNDMVQDNGVLAIALLSTQDRAGPIFGNDETYHFDDAPTWDTGQTSVSTLTVGSTVTLAAPCILDSIRVWISSDSPNVWYRLGFVDATDPNNLIYDILPSFTGDGPGIGWLSYNMAGRLFPAGAVLSFFLESWNDLSSSSFDASYAYSTPGNSTPPLSGQITHDNQNIDTMLVHYIDNDALDWTSSIRSLSAGDRIASEGQEWVITNNVDNVTYAALTISPAEQLATDGVKVFRLTAFAPQPIDYSRLIDHWLNYTSVHVADVYGFSEIAGSAPVESQDGYGIDFRLESVYKSSHWDWMATLDLSSLGGSGSPTAAEAGPGGQSWPPGGGS